MNLKRVTFKISYVVDGDNEFMVDEATDCIYEDVCNAVKFGEVTTYIRVEDAPDATEGDIASFLLEEDEEDFEE